MLEEFENQLVELIIRFPELPYEDIAESLEYYAAHYRKLANKED